MINEIVKYYPVAKKNARRTLSRRTQPNAKEYVHRLGYNTLTTTYSQDVSVCRLSGSSINRQQSKLNRDEHQIIYQTKEKIQTYVSKKINELLQRRIEISDVPAFIDSLQRHKKRISGTSGKCGVSIHLLSKRTKGKVRDKATAFYRACGDQKTFATLTFLNDIKDDQAMRLLNKFFTECRRLFGKDFQYMWIAERQQSGRIHFHSIINRYLPVRQFNSLWVMQQ